MDIEEQKTGKWSEIWISRHITTFALCVSLAPSLGEARQMECSYDYITHVTTLQLNDMDADNGPISYIYSHSVSPRGGEEMYLFNERDPAELQGTGQFEFIMEKLFFDPSDTWRSIKFVDFERPTLKGLQALTAYLEQATDTIDAPLVVWNCHRTD